LGQLIPVTQPGQAEDRGRDEREARGSTKHTEGRGQGASRSTANARKPRAPAPVAGGHCLLTSLNFIYLTWYVKFILIGKYLTGHILIKCTLAIDNKWLMLFQVMILPTYLNIVSCVSIQHKRKPLNLPFYGNSLPGLDLLF